MAVARREFFDLARMNKAPIAAEPSSVSMLCSPSNARPTVLPLSAFGCAMSAAAGHWSKHSDCKALDYSFKRWSALTRFLNDGRLCLWNSAAERELHAVAVGRQNRLR
jgi:transposase